MHHDLSFDQAPPFAAPLRFFLTAPWFGAAAGLLLAVTGADALASRWSPASLAAAHLFALGFMSQVMFGALFQFLPVAIGRSLWRPVAVATVVHLLLGVGTLLLATGFLAGAPALLLAAAALLFAGIVAFALITGAALWQADSGATAVPLLRLALAALVVAATLGALLAAGLALSLPLRFAGLTDVHLGWGVGGWALALLAAVSTFVVPMFQLTPTYPARVARRAAPALGLLLLLLSLRALPAVGPGSAWNTVAEAAGAGVALLAAAWAGATLHLQAHRRRKVGDATFHFFRAGVLCLMAAAVVLLAMAALPQVADEPRLATALGVLLLPGAFSCVIQGMLYKIVPFLAWLHLQRTGAPATSLPNMRAFIAEGAARGQLRLHLAALAALLLAVAWPTLPFAAPVAGLTLAASYAWLGVNLARAAARYRGFRDRIRAAAADRGW